MNIRVFVQCIYNVVIVGVICMHFANVAIFIQVPADNEVATIVVSGFCELHE